MLHPTDPWLHASLITTPDPLVAALVPTLTAYRQWCEADGVVGLLRAARRMTLDADAADEAVSATFLDVRQRMVDCVERARSGRSVPGFTTVEQVARYHRIQVRLRVQKRWESRRPAAVALQDVTLSSDADVEASVSAQREALPLRFALCWTLCDMRSRAAHKDTGWWWRMLRHGLDLESAGGLGSDRNDPTEIAGRFRLRLAVARQLRPWITQWAKGRDGWDDLAVGIPETCPDTADVLACLPTLRALLARGIDRAGLLDAEAAELRKMLVGGTLVRVGVRRFGSRQAMVDAARRVGASAR